MDEQEFALKLHDIWTDEFGGVADFYEEDAHYKLTLVKVSKRIMEELCAVPQKKTRARIST